MHFSKVLLLITSTLDNVIAVREEQPKNALSPISLRLLLERLFKPVQLANALLPIFVRESNVSDVRLLQPENAVAFISLRSGASKLTREVQPLNALLPIWVTFSIPLTVLKEEQFKKHSFAIDAEPSGNVTLFKLVQPLNNDVGREVI